MLRVSGSLQKSGEVMKLVNESIKLPEMQRTMFEMSKGEGVGTGAYCIVSRTARVRCVRDVLLPVLSNQ
jgi:hypothetical protein